MYIHDPIYGSFDITERVLLELLEDPTVKRVAGVMQGGTTPQLWGWPDFSRLEHCVGAMLLVRHLGGSLEEQIAALLHDVPHTAFSHVIDFVYRKDGSQNFHEEVKETLFQKSHIPDILRSYGFSLEQVLDESRFSLLEQHAPLLCADRVDYTLRILPYYFNDLHTAVYLFKHLTVKNNQIVFDGLEPAQTFTQVFIRFIRDVVAGLENQAAYNVFAEAIRYALEHHYITQDELFQTDQEVSQQLHQIQDEFVQHRLRLLVPGFAVIEDETTYDYAMRTKMRWVNPPYVEGESLAFVLDNDPQLKEEVESYKDRVMRPYYVKVQGL